MSKTSKINLIKTRIKDGSLYIHRDLPIETRNYFIENNNYIVLKTRIFQDQHSEKYRNLYDIYITFDETIIKKINLNFIGNKDNIDIGKYKKIRKGVSYFIYLSKEKFSEFIRVGTTKIKIKNKKSDKFLEFILNEEVYEKFLLLTGYLSIEGISIEKEKKRTRGFSNFYLFLKQFMQAINTNKIEESYFYNAYIKEIIKNKNLDEYDFSNPSKRTKYKVNVAINILDNQDLLISRDRDFNLDNKDISILELEIKKACKDGYKLYNTNYVKKNSDKEFKDNIQKHLIQFHQILQNLRLNSQEYINGGFVEKFLFFFSFLKLNFQIFKQRFKLSNHLSDIMPLFLSLFNAFQKTYPNNKLNKGAIFFIIFTDKNLNDFINKNKELFNQILLFSKDYIYLFEVFERLEKIKKNFNEYFAKEEEIDKIIDLSFELTKIVFKKVNSPINILSASIFTLFLIGIEKENQVRLSKICEFNYINQYSLNRCILKIISVSQNSENPQNWDFKKFKILDKQNEIKTILIKFLLEKYIIELINESRKKRFSMEKFRVLLERFEFFFSYISLENELKTIKNLLLILDSLIVDLNLELPIQSYKIFSRYINQLNTK